MKTRIDAAVSNFLNAMVEGDDDLIEPERLVQKPLDDTRLAFGIDSVSIIEKNGSRNIYTYRFESVSRPEYSKKGVSMTLSDEEFYDVLHMYDDNRICERIVKTAEDAGVSNNIIHYGFVREKFTVSDGSICFECYGEHSWSDEERAALVKVGKAFKMVHFYTLAEDKFDVMYERLDEERRQYRKGLTDGATYSFSMDITDGFIRENIITARGIDILKEMGLELPIGYDELHRKFLETGKVKFYDDDMAPAFTCKGLIDLFNSGNTHPEIEYYYAGWDAHIRVTVFLYQDKRTSHINGLFVAVDITEAKRKQELQKQALQAAYDAASQANAAKSTFLSNMSHDIRTPMNGIIGMTAIAATHLDDKDRVADCLGKISSASKHLLGIINDVLDMSKIESGQIELQNEEFALPDLVDSILNITKPLYENRHHTLSVNISNILHEKVIGDSRRLEQVFINLLGNSAKYTPDGGTITLSITEKPVGNPKVGHYEFVVEDNGIGMSEASLANLFRPFSRADDERVARVQGTGLVLAITRNIVHIMNGDIRVESKLDVGTRFTVTLFLELAEQDDDTSYEKLVDLPVLIADDDELACEATCAVLTELGMRGEYVHSGEEAVNAVIEKHRSGEGYFAVILDWKMPHLNGLETATKIRSELHDNVPIIIISAYDWSDIEQPAREVGVNGFLSKPLFKSKMAYLFKGIIAGDDQTKTLNALQSVRKADYNGKRVLLVEDNELNAEIGVEILSMANLQVDTACDGTVAVEKVSASPEGYYDIVLMDIQMPKMNGHDATRAIRALDRKDAHTLPIIAMTANAFVEDIQRSKEAGMNGHISKPIELDKLLAALSEWTDVS